MSPTTYQNPEKHRERPCFNDWKRQPRNDPLSTKYHEDG